MSGVIGGTSITAGGRDGISVDNGATSANGNFPVPQPFKYQEPELSLLDAHESELQFRLCHTFLDTRQVPLPLKTPARKALSTDVSQGVRKRSSPHSSSCHEVADAKKRNVSKCLFDSPMENNCSESGSGVSRCLFGVPTDEQNDLVTTAVEARLKHEYHNFCHRFGVPEENF